MIARDARHRGFTLAELLVATTLLSIVMASVYTMFHSTMRTWRSVEGGVDLHQDARNALTLFQHELDNLVPAAGYLFEGEDNEITFFITSEPMNVEEAEGKHLLRVRYYYSRGKDALIREEGLVEAALPQRPPDDRELDRTRIKVKKEEKFVVAENVDSVTFTYIWLPLPEKRDPKVPPKLITPIEVNHHKERWGLPQGVQVSITFEDPEDKSKKLTITSRMPIRVPSAWRKKSGPNGLDEILGEVE